MEEKLAALKLNREEDGCQPQRDCACKKLQSATNNADQIDNKGENSH